MRKLDQGVRFSYPAIYKNILIGSATLILAALVWISAKLLPIFLSDPSKDSMFFFCGMLIFYLIAFGGVLVIMLNSAQDFVFSKEGLRLQVFRYWWRELAWDDVLELKEPWLYPGFTILILRRLTPFHRLLGLVYGFTFKPAFFIHISLGVDDYKKALDMIRKYAMNLR
jgi:hypothetical protein